MANATIIRVDSDGTTVTISARVIEGGTQGNKEYIATVPLADLNALPNNAAKKVVLIAALKAVRDSQIAPTITDLSSIASGVIVI